MKFHEEFCESRKFSCASTGCVELCFTRTETGCSLFQTSAARCYVLYIALISRDTSGVLPNRQPNLSHCDQRVPANLFEQFRAVQEEDKCVACLRDINFFTARLLSVVGLRTCVDSCWMVNCMSGLQGAMKMSFPTAARKLD